jgi:uncharacterized membrane protein YoaK (UPF0700 family)
MESHQSPQFTILTVFAPTMPPAETTTQLEALPDALLLAATGGILDAIVFLNHGHVFANTMTGNFIFLGIAFLSHNWNQIILHLAPLAAFFAGVTTSKHLRNRLGVRSIPFGLNLEIAAIFVLGWLPGRFPDIAFTTIIAFVAAIQVASIRHVERFAYNSTFMTGNLAEPRLLTVAIQVSRRTPSPTSPANSR